MLFLFENLKRNLNSVKSYHSLYSSVLHAAFSLCAVQKLDGGNFRPLKKLLLLIAVADQVWDVFVYSAGSVCVVYNFSNFWISLYLPSKRS